jgi:Cu+-exporting ATPase
LGSLRWLSAEGVDCAETNGFFAEEWMDKGATIIGLAVDARLVALFALRDAIKAKTYDTIAWLRENFRLYIVSGDSRRSVNAMADELGFYNLEQHIFAEVRPEEKAQLIKQLQAKGERVAFVGDGINDAPALEQADLGIAVSRASDVARAAADIILLKSEIEAVPEALQLARATLRTIKQNLFWAFFYNCVGIPLAALGFMSPVLCAAAMGFSDIIVIGNALKLKWQFSRK